MNTTTIVVIPMKTEARLNFSIKGKNNNKMTKMGIAPLESVSRIPPLTTKIYKNLNLGFTILTEINKPINKICAEALGLR